MKNLLLVLFSCLIWNEAYGISDTLYLKNGEKKVVEITKVETNRILYKYLNTSTREILPAQIEKKLVDSCVSSNLLIDSIPDLAFYRHNYHLSESEYKLKWVKHNLEKFHKQKRIGHAIMGASLACGIAYVFEPEALSGLSYIAGGLGLIAFIVELDSYRWIRNASFETKASSVSVTIRF